MRLWTKLCDLPKEKSGESSVAGKRQFRGALTELVVATPLLPRNPIPWRLWLVLVLVGRLSAMGKICDHSVRLEDLQIEGRFWRGVVLAKVVLYGD